jgi:Mn2+/Fe2+ NRAMP family transporter
MLILLLSDIGATITPWMLFFQQGAVSDKGLTVRDIRHGRIDTTLGATLAAIAALACIIATAPLYVHHMNASQFGTAQFAQALVPFIGRVGGALFALGVLEAGLVAATVISTSSAYAFGEVTQTAHSLNHGVWEAKGFYAMLLGIAAVAGCLVLLPGFPLEMVVIMVNVIAVLTMPPAIGFLLILANDKEIMGPYKSTWWLNALGLAVGIFVTMAGIVYALSVIVPQWF